MFIFLMFFFLSLFVACLQQENNILLKIVVKSNSFLPCFLSNTDNGLTVSKDPTNVLYSELLENGDSRTRLTMLPRVKEAFCLCKDEDQLKDSYKKVHVDNM